MRGNQVAPCQKASVMCSGGGVVMRRHQCFVALGRLVED